MTAQEKKAIELERAAYPDVVLDFTDEELLRTADVQTTLRGMEWANKEAEAKHQSIVGDLMRQITELNRECAELRLRLQNWEGEQE